LQSNKFWGFPKYDGLARPRPGAGISVEPAEIPMYKRELTIKHPDSKKIMGPIEKRRQLLRRLPGVDRVLEWTAADPALAETPKPVRVRCIRAVLEGCRNEILSNGHEPSPEELGRESILRRVGRDVSRAMTPNLRRVINAAGIIVHTNLGRSPLAPEVQRAVLEIAGTYSNLEFDLAQGRRGLRYAAIEEILCEVSGAEAAMAVNNNAGAVLLCLDTLARGREVIVSRGELVEIGGSFRIPDVMAKSGAILREVGTTNRTHPRDYEGAIQERTALLLKVHQSNFSIVGFSREVTGAELSEIGGRRGVPVMNDLGSGSFIDVSRYGLLREPTVQETVASGADVVTFSGDKLLGGPQAGLIVGRREHIDQIRKNPLTRALRVDKMTLAALEATLRLYRDPERAVAVLPTLQMMTEPVSAVTARAEQFRQAAEELTAQGLRCELIDGVTRVGGGSLPLQELPTRCAALHPAGGSVNGLERALRSADPPVIGRIEDERLLLDFRTVRESEIDLIVHALAAAIGGAEK
jgi:L-seryl-tRNA(Ser) seleniumtransferase